MVFFFRFLMEDSYLNDTKYDKFDVYKFKSPILWSILTVTRIILVLVLIEKISKLFKSEIINENFKLHCIIRGVD